MLNSIQQFQTEGVKNLVDVFIRYGNDLSKMAEMIYGVTEDILLEFTVLCVMMQVTAEIASDGLWSEFLHRKGGAPVIGGIGFESYKAYNEMSYNTAADADTSRSVVPADTGVSRYSVTTEREAKKAGMTDAEIRGLKKSGQIECSTCASRKYQDGSDENVSFKSAAHISPNAAGAAVRAHEGEHVSNAYKKAAMGDGKVLRASVAIHMSTCPECGRSYVSGGTTHTSISYKKEQNSYGADGKSRLQGVSGANFDSAV